MFLSLMGSIRVKNVGSARTDMEALDTYSNDIDLKHPYKLGNLTKKVLE